MASRFDRPPKLTPRHLAVIGVLQLAPHPMPEAIARELHFEVAEVMRLLGDLAVLGYIAWPTGQ